MKVSHQWYIIPGIVDRAAVMKQAERDRDFKGEASIVHAHAEEVFYGDSIAEKEDCEDACVVLEPGYKTRNIQSDVKELLEEQL